MTAVNPALTSINSGEFSPRMEARVDFDRYPNAAKMCRNFLLLPQGGITRRPGTRFIKEVKTSSLATRGLPFQFSQDQAYFIEMGDTYARFYRRQARLDAANISASITNGTFASNIDNWTDPYNLATTTFVATTNDNANAASYTFSSASIGAAHADRIVVVGVNIYDDAQDVTISSVTIGGTAAEEIEQANANRGAGNSLASGLYYLRVTSGTTADIVVTPSTGVLACTINVFRVLNSEGTVFSSSRDQTISADVLSTTVTVPRGGTAVGVALFDSDTAAYTAIAWAGLDEDNDSNQEGNRRNGAAHADVSAGETNRTISATGTGGGGVEAGTLVVASFGANSLSHDSTNQRLQLNDLSDYSYAEQAVSITETSTEHTLQFRMAGYGGAKFDLRIGTTSGGAEVLEVENLAAGEHTFTFTPGAATIYIGFRQLNVPIRDMWLDNVAFIDNAPVEVVTPYATADLESIRVFQAADVMYLLHPDYRPRRLERRGHKSWSMVEAFFEDGPYNEINPGTDLEAAQKINNPFFENGQKDWTAVTLANGKVESEPGQNRIKLTSADDADDSAIRQQFTAEPNKEHVVHFAVRGVRTDTEFIYARIGTTASPTKHYNNTDVAPGWTSAAFTPTTATQRFQTGIGDSECSPMYIEAVLIYGASAKLMRVSSKTGEVTLTAVGHTPFASTDVGRLVRLEWPGNEPGYGIITAYTSSSVVTLLVLRGMAYSGVCTEKWQLGAWSDTDGWPEVIGFHDGRAVLANNDAMPQSLWFSQSDDLQNMRPDSWVEGEVAVEDDDAIAITLNSVNIDPINWLAPARDLVIGTAGAEWVVSSEGASVTPSDISAKINSVTPSAAVQPALSNQVALFLDRSKRELYEVGFSFDDQSYVTTLMTILADHIFRSPGSELAFQRLPHSVVWCEREDGRAMTLSYNRQHEILGWSQQIFGGSFSGGDAVVESIAVIPGAEDSNQVNNSNERDEVWLIIKRTINGSTVRYIEVLEGVFEGPLREDYDTEEEWLDAMRTAQADAFYVDSGLTYEGASTTSITGLSHLEGQTVKVFANGRVQASKTVSSGAITIDSAATKVQVGLAYTSRYESLKLAVGGQAGTALNKVKAVTGCGFVLLDSGQFKATSVDYDEFSGRRQHDLQILEPRRETMPKNEANPLVTGEKSISLETSFPSDPRVYIETDLPLPLTILALLPEMKATDARHTP